ncbi:MAG: YggS family pyridoxal phosphate-dependent enzyme [Bacteroidales bacterium]|jgi:pyridoxal phosphate enzyme (YggS family)|nr:YggS family pyridoxal phosphate-dependent enzyme [Bacteroidales bacterium]
MNSIAGNIKKLTDELPLGVSLVAVTKTRTPEEAGEAYDAGLRTFGENRVQEMAEKKSLLPSDISWHLIGHLQSNKVKQAVAAASMIESVDSVRLLRLIDDEAAAQGKTINCLLQLHIATEQTKTGFSLSDAMDINWSEIISSLDAVKICGVMGMATFTENTAKVRAEFKSLAGIFRLMRDVHFAGYEYFSEISMGMSGDWRVAVEEGSTMIRVGSLIFGERIKK